jgi:hypothetical protein
LLEPDQAEIEKTCPLLSNEKQSGTPGLHTLDAAFDREGFLSKYRRSGLGACWEYAEQPLALLPNA